MRKVVFVSKNKKEIMRKYFYEYLIELSQYDYENIKFDKNGTPIYKWFDCYWLDSGRFPIFLIIKNNIAGLAMVRELNNNKYEIAEFFVLPEFRKDDNAVWFANSIFDLFDGDFELSAKLKNKRAINFWQKIAMQKNCQEFVEKDGWREWLIKNNNKINYSDNNQKIENNFQKTKNNVKNNQKNKKNHELNLKAIYFDLIKNGKKTLEGRLNSPKIQEFKIGDTITFFKEPLRQETIKAEILDKYIFDDFDQMADSLNKDDLGFENQTKEQMVAVYRKIYDKERETKHGVCIIKIKVLK